MTAYVTVYSHTCKEPRGTLLLVLLTYSVLNVLISPVNSTYCIAASGEFNWNEPRVVPKRTALVVRIGLE